MGAAHIAAVATTGLDLFFQKVFLDVAAFPSLRRRSGRSQRSWTERPKNIFVCYELWLKTRSERAEKTLKEAGTYEQACEAGLAIAIDSIRCACRQSHRPDEGDPRRLCRPSFHRNPTPGRLPVRIVEMRKNTHRKIRNWLSALSGSLVTGMATVPRMCRRELNSAFSFGRFLRCTGGVAFALAVGVTHLSDKTRNDTMKEQAIVKISAEPVQRIASRCSERLCVKAELHGSALRFHDHLRLWFDPVGSTERSAMPAGCAATVPGGKPEAVGRRP